MDGIICSIASCSMRSLQFCWLVVVVSLVDGIKLSHGLLICDWHYVGGCWIQVFVLVGNTQYKCQACSAQLTEKSNSSTQ